MRQELEEKNEESKVCFKELSKPGKEPLFKLEEKEMLQIPGIEEVKDQTPENWYQTYNLSLDGYSMFPQPDPISQEEKAEIVKRFLHGLKKLLSPKSNWTFIRPLKLSLENCVRCNTCADACHLYLASGRKEVYRPNFRSEILRKIYEKHFTLTGKLNALLGEEIDITYDLIRRLFELAYRCTLCRRCVLYCPIGVDNGLIARELRKLFSQELGWAPPEVHQKGTRLHLKAGSSTGMNPQGIKDTISFLEEEIAEKTGKKIKIPVDKKGAEYLFIHNAGEYISWPDHMEAFFILFDAAGINYTISSEPLGYDGVNYGAWYDDVELARIAVNHLKIAHSLGVKKILVGECGHAHKVFCVILDRLLPASSPLAEIKRESCLPLVWEIVKSGKLKLDPSRNDFYFTLHDSCNIVRLMGIVKPQREVLNRIVPPGRFREMNPNGVKNYCCGGGSGFAIMGSLNFPTFRKKVGIKVKLCQIMETFQDVLKEDKIKLVVATCSNCKGTIREMEHTYHLFEKYKITHCGLVDLVVNAMVDIPPFLNFEEML
ncbi:4Fe-4S ferredoxin [Thermodesulfobacterium commune DSM 2178]|uniref:4Fe-4S ferredoxin n=1 Tax=Thermodesulfobacterium commune DSM 2178 TaxID=289377 RepID=A0A075WVM9_9BACT|nr:4Fe-4S ferredoxin [Thermodesulfobacterium commune DSM 2178]